MKAIFLVLIMGFGGAWSIKVNADETSQPVVWGAVELYQSIAATQANLKKALGADVFKGIRKLDFESKLNVQKNGARVRIYYTLAKGEEGMKQYFKLLWSKAYRMMSRCPYPPPLAPLAALRPRTSQRATSTHLSLLGADSSSEGA